MEIPATSGYDVHSLEGRRAGKASRRHGGRAEGCVGFRMRAGGDSSGTDRVLAGWRGKKEKSRVEGFEELTVP
jgi:hypothetical protein